MTQPLVGYHFIVDWGGARGGFTEVTGLDMQAELLEYREGWDKDYAPRRIPGLRRHANIVLRRGIFLGDNSFFEWLDATRLAMPERRNMTVSILNAEHEPAVTWKLRDAWPVKIAGPRLDALHGGFAIETLEVAHEGMTIEHA